MGLPRFTYLAPASLEEACALLAEHKDKARLMAGGTDLLIRMGQRAMRPEIVVGLKAVSGLDHLIWDPKKGLTIGAMALLADAADHPEVKRRYTALAASAKGTATVQVRNMGTIVGNLCNAAPSADNAPPLLVHQAEIVIAGPGGERTLPLDEFFLGPGLTALETGEIVKEVRVPTPGPRTGSSYQKLSARSRVDIAGVGAAAFIKLDESGACALARVAVGAVAPVPLRAGAAEEVLTGRVLTTELMARAAAKAAEKSSPITDVRASGPYRRRMVEVLTARAVKEALEIASENKAE